MASDFVDMSLIDHPTWCYTDPAGLRPEFLPYTATNSWPDQPDSPSWNRCDELVCAIFSAWDELPRSILHPWTPEQELQALLRLDGLVNAFQLYLPANPNAFRDWGEPGPSRVSRPEWRGLRYPEITVEGLPAGYGMGVEVSVMGNPRPALQQPSLLQNAGGLAPWRQMQRHVAASQFGVSSLSLHDSMEQMEENRAPKEDDSGVLDSTGDDE
ncbi:High mobility group protein B3 [Verticillium dahliae VDG1]|nr:High mobility group protein B3 [Verticillium dahliae VDG1]